MQTCRRAGKRVTSNPGRLNSPGVSSGLILPMARALWHTAARVCLCSELIIRAWYASDKDSFALRLMGALFEPSSTGASMQAQGLVLAYEPATIISTVSPAYPNTHQSSASWRSPRALATWKRLMNCTERSLALMKCCGVAKVTDTTGGHIARRHLCRHSCGNSAGECLPCMQSGGSLVQPKAPIPLWLCPQFGREAHIQGCP